MTIDELEVLKPTGETVVLGQERGGRPGMIVLVRHFGCIFCRQRIARLVEETAEYSDKDFAVWIVGNGTPDMALDFVVQHQITRTVFSDPSRRVYKFFGMKRNFGLNLRTVGQALTALRDGHRQTGIKGDPWQQGGVVLFDARGEVLLARADEDAGGTLPWALIHETLPPVSAVG